MSEIIEICIDIKDVKTVKKKRFYVLKHIFQNSYPKMTEVRHILVIKYRRSV